MSRKKVFLERCLHNSQENTSGLRNFQKHLFYRTLLDDCFWLFRATLLKWDTANSVWKTSVVYSLSRNRINIQCMSSLVYTVYCQKQPSEQKCSVKRGVLKDFVNFVGKHLFWSLVLIKFQAWHLFAITSTNDSFCTALAPLTVTYPFYFLFSTFFLISTATIVNISDVCFGSNSKGFKEFKSDISFSLRSHFHCCYFLLPCFFSLSQFCFNFSCHSS